LAKFDLKEYARRGATRECPELKAELAEDLSCFPDLSAPANAIGSGEAVKAGDWPHARCLVPLASLRRREADSVTTTRRRRRMSPAARKAVSERMRKYWAQRRKAKRRQQV